MRRHPKTIFSDVVPQRIGIHALTSLDGIPRIRPRGGRRRHYENRPQQDEQASRWHRGYSLKGEVEPRTDPKVSVAPHRNIGVSHLV
jgi:hypothetical protein